MEREINSEKLHEFLLLVGFISISIATLAAYLTPATGYELSIYNATPLLFWMGFSVSLFLSVLISFLTNNRKLRSLAFGLGGFAFVSLILLPVIRSWYYMSKSDGLSHLGATRDLINGTQSMTNMTYPVIHGLNIFTSRVTGFGIERSFLIVIAIFVLVFIIFVPLTTRLLSNTSWVVATAVFSGLLILPINPAAVRLEPHPSSQAILFIAMVLYMVVFVFISKSRSASLLLTLSTFIVVLLHPQQAANVLILLSTFAMIQLIHSWQLKDDTSLVGGPIYSQAIVLGILFWIWVHANVTTLFEVGVTRAFRIIAGTRDSVTAESVQTRSLSLDTLGGSIEELFLKVFLVSAVYCLICGLLMGTHVLGLLNRRPEKLYQFFKEIFSLPSSGEAIVGYWTIGFIPVSFLFVVYVIGGITDQYFRHAGFLMVTVSVFGALAIGQLLESLSSVIPKKAVSIVAIATMVVFLSLSIPVVFESPYVYQDSHHITEAEINGQETALENTVNGNPHTMVRTGVNRFAEAIYGADSSESNDINTDPAIVPDHFASRDLTGEGDESEYYRDLPGYFDNTAYLFITEENRQLETSVYNGFRWSDEDFQYLERDSDIDRIQDNGEFNLYIINQDRGG